MVVVVMGRMVVVLGMGMAGSDLLFTVVDMYVHIHVGREGQPRAQVDRIESNRPTPDQPSTVNRSKSTNKV